MFGRRKALSSTTCGAKQDEHQQLAPTSGPVNGELARRWLGGNEDEAHLENETGEGVCSVRGSGAGGGRKQAAASQSAGPADRASAARLLVSLRDRPERDRAGQTSSLGVD